MVNRLLSSYPYWHQISFHLQEQGGTFGPNVKKKKSILSILMAWWLSGKELASQGRRHGFNPWVGIEMATQASILVWRIPWAEEPRWLEPTGSKKSRTRLSIENNILMAIQCLTLKEKWNQQQSSNILMANQSLGITVKILHTFLVKPAGMGSM